MNFNPHSRKGSDTSSNIFNIVRTNFNPHSRKGSDMVTKWLQRI